MDRIECLYENGYNPIHLFGRWYIGRKFSKYNPRWFARIPLYTVFHLTNI